MWTYSEDRHWLSSGCCLCNTSCIFKLIINEVELMALFDWLCNFANLGAIPFDDVLFNNTVDMVLRATRTE